MYEPIGNIWSPAHQAVENSDAYELARLLDSGVDPNEICGDMTLLAHAVDLEADAALQGDGKMGVTLIAILLAFGASPRLAAESGKSPLDLAREYEHTVAQKLLERFA